MSRALPKNIKLFGIRYGPPNKRPLPEPDAGAIGRERILISGTASDKQSR